MKINHVQAFTRVEAVAIAGILLFMLLLLVVVCIPGTKIKYDNARCVETLKMASLAFQDYSRGMDHKFPMARSTNDEGTMEFVDSPQVFRHFQALSNQLRSPKYLAHKKYLRATNWADLENVNIDYFVGVDASEEDPNSLLAGDRFIASDVPLANRLLILRSNAGVAWQAQPHRSCGNVAFGD